jgi:hypothetical protein
MDVFLNFTIEIAHKKHGANSDVVFEFHLKISWTMKLFHFNGDGDECKSSKIWIAKLILRWLSYRSDYELENSIYAWADTKLASRHEKLTTKVKA